LLQWAETPNRDVQRKETEDRNFARTLAHLPTSNSAKSLPATIDEEQIEHRILIFRFGCLRVTRIPRRVLLF
jgi:hypothetical protein